MFRVLVIDDNPDMRALIGVILEGAGYSVGLGDGYLYTARELGAHAVLTKPFDQERLLQVVRSLHKTEQQ